MQFHAFLTEITHTTRSRFFRQTLKGYSWRWLEKATDSLIEAVIYVKRHAVKLRLSSLTLKFLN
jgi:hypothetical protein